MPNIERHIQISLSPEEVAEAFLSCDSDSQARILECIAVGARDKWGDYNANLQFSYLGQALVDRVLWTDSTFKMLEHIIDSVKERQKNPSPHGLSIEKHKEEA